MDLIRENQIGKGKLKNIIHKNIKEKRVGGKKKKKKEEEDLGSVGGSMRCLEKRGRCGSKEGGEGHL